MLHGYYTDNSSIFRLPAGLKLSQHTQKLKNGSTKFTSETCFVYPFCLPTLCTHLYLLKMSESSPIKNVRKLWKTNISFPLIRTRTYGNQLFVLNCKKNVKFLHELQQWTKMGYRAKFKTSARHQVRDHLLSTYAKVSFKLAIPIHWYAQMQQKMHQLLSPSGRSDAHFCLISVNTTSSPIKVLSSCFNS